MSEVSSSQSVWVSPGVIGHETEIGYDILHGIEIAKVMSESLRMHDQRGSRVLKDMYGNAAIREIGRPISRKDYVVCDTQTGLYLKSYQDLRDAELQFAAMNTLSGWLAEQEVGVRAVRHFALVERAGDTPVAVVEPATGERLIEMGLPKKETRAILRDVRTRLDQAIGKRASRALVNDLDLHQNYGGNVFIDEAGTYTLIDQPVTLFANKKRARQIVIDAGWPMPLEQSRWVDAFTFDPFDTIRAREATD